jgi:hypothetical protein
LIDENDYEGNWRGRMKVVSISMKEPYLVKCDHPFYDELIILEADELVVMEEADD